MGRAAGMDGFVVLQLRMLIPREKQENEKFDDKEFLMRKTDE